MQLESSAWVSFSGSLTPEFVFVFPISLLCYLLAIHVFTVWLIILIIITALLKNKILLGTWKFINPLKTRQRGCCNSTYLRKRLQELSQLSQRVESPKQLRWGTLPKELTKTFIDLGKSKTRIKIRTRWTQRRQKRWTPVTPLQSSLDLETQQ